MNQVTSRIKRAQTICFDISEFLGKSPKYTHLFICERSFIRCKCFVIKLEGKEPIGKSKLKWDVDVKMDVIEIWYELDITGSG
jgi:hypothetical protein